RWPLLAARSPFVSRDRAASSPAPTASGELGMAILLRGTSAAAAATAGPSSTLLATTFRRARGCGRLLPAAPRLRRAFAARASAQPLEVCAKESITVPGRLGDCPFTQRVLLTIEEKHLPYDLKLVDLANKPDWLFEMNPEGKVPIVKLEDKWIADSDVITQALEEKYPEPPLATPLDKASVGSKIFSTFIGFLKSKDPSDGTEQALLDELTSFDSYLKDNGPFINGGTISAADLSLGPKLYHMEIALGHYKNWSVPDSLSHVKQYMKSIFSMDSFVKTRALPEDVIAGWRPKVMG
uniref:GST N-terminal domain-containing protein n=3 Tax=Setaria TaxID=4554 RepID=K3Y2G0_SETIT